jgi:hypothetical protein
MNDLRITKKFDIIDLRVTGCHFKSIQNIMSRELWNSYLQEVSDTRLINVTDASGNSLSETIVCFHGTPLWGNLARNYDTVYCVSAPYVNLALDVK